LNGLRSLADSATEEYGESGVRLLRPSGEGLAMTKQEALAMTKRKGLRMKMDVVEQPPAQKAGGL